MGKRKKRKSGKDGSGGGMMMGMRSGFKKAANSVTGKSPVKNRKMDWILTGVTALLAMFLIYQLFLK